MTGVRPANDLTGKVAIVTGGGAAGDGIGNGRATCVLLAEAGAQVMVVDRKLDLAARTVEMIRDEGGAAVAHEADVTDEAQCEAMIAAATQGWGRLDVLVNNVGIGSLGTVISEDMDRWQKVMDVNLHSMVLTSRHAIPA